MSKKEKRVTLICFDQRRIRRLRPLARLVSGLLPWCGPLSLLHRGADGRRALVLLALVHWAGFLAILFVVLFAVFQVLALFLR